MADHSVSVYPARVVARAHSDVQIYEGWGQATVLFVDVDRGPDDKGIVPDATKGYDVTQSMMKLLEQAAREHGIDYTAPTYPEVTCDGPRHLGGGPLPRAVILAEGDDFVATLPDGRKENVGVDVTQILTERLAFLQAGSPEKPSMGSELPQLSCRFAIPASGEGVELLQYEMSGAERRVSIDAAERRVVAAAFDLGDQGTDRGL